MAPIGRSRSSVTIFADVSSLGCGQAVVGRPARCDDPSDPAPFQKGRRRRRAGPLLSLAWSMARRSRPRMMKTVISTGWVVAGMRVRKAYQGISAGSSCWRGVAMRFLLQAQRVRRRWRILARPAECRRADTARLGSGCVGAAGSVAVWDMRTLQHRTGTLGKRFFLIWGEYLRVSARRATVRGAGAGPPA